VGDGLSVMPGGGVAVATDGVFVGAMVGVGTTF
jgi:hypothetical protein